MLRTVLSLQWAELDRTLRISTILGLIGGGVGATLGAFVGAGFGFQSFLFFFFPVISLLCSLGLLYLPMSKERRGVLGFLSVVGSLTPLLFLTLLILSLVFPHRDTPTGL
jgi:hypothetical protein